LTTGHFCNLLVREMASPETDHPMTRSTAPISTVKQEMEAGRRHTPGFGWPTILLTFALFAAALGATWGALGGHLSYLVAAIVNTVFFYAIYTPVHEAVHANISLKQKHLRWVDDLIGHLCCAPLWLFYLQHRKQHMVHHRAANTDNDPDIYARGSFPGWVFLRLPKSLISYFNPVSLYRECLRFDVPRRQIAITMLTYAAQAAVVVWLLTRGYGFELLVLYLIPWWIGQSVMLTLFTWTPHHDHSETGRYRDTRASVFPGANALLLGQNHHLIHHMMPGVPWYRYEVTFNDIRPLLEQNGARIEGFWPGKR
jgi:beta-carotene hydroxylase